MTRTWATPSRTQIHDAFRDHNVNFIEHPHCSPGRSPWVHGLRAVTMHHTAGKNSADYLATHWNLPGANACIANGRYNGHARDGLAVILSWGDCWHTGQGGPWPGVAGRDSLHLTSWGNEVESVGTMRDITDPQIETGGRILAAFWDLAGIREHTHRHADWTDGTGPVPGGPLPTVGRKIDTRADKGYTTGFWLAQGDKYVHRALWDGVVPSLEAIATAQATDAPSPAAWRLACRLADLGHYVGVVRPRGEQRYPGRAVKAWQSSIGAQPTGRYGPRAHAAIFAA